MAYLEDMEELSKWVKEESFYDYDDFLSLLENIEEGFKTLEEYEQTPEIFDEEEIGFLKGDLEDWQEEILEIKKAYNDAKRRAK